MVASQTSVRVNQQKTLCVGRGFAERVEPNGLFPEAVLAQTSDFAFTLEQELAPALERLRRDASIALLLIDADSEGLPVMLAFVREARRCRPRLPIVAFSESGGDTMRYLLREGASWHFTKRSRSISHLARALRRHAPLISESEVWTVPVPPAHSESSAAEWPTGNPTGDGAGDKVPNPYVVGRPLTGPADSLYTGRAEVFVWAAENLAVPPRPNPLLLYGERRIGKTSTLYQMVGGERGRALREDGSRRLIPVYIDLQRLAGSPTDEWLRRLARDVYRQIATQGIIRSAPESRAGSDSAFAVVDRTLDYLEQNLPDGSAILLAIDELEQLQAGIASGLLQGDIFPFLRSQVQHRSRLAWVFSGSYGLLETFWRPLADLTSRFELGPLTADEARDLIRRPVAGRLVYDDATIERIVQHTSGRPFQIQRICHRLFSLHTRRRIGEAVLVEDVEAVIAELARDPVPVWAIETEHTDRLLEP